LPLLVVEEGGDGGLRVRRAGLWDYVEAVGVLLWLIPVGRVTTYGVLAGLLGVSPRLVGRALALNPEPVVRPCHRVVRGDGGLGGYSRGGPRVKEALLRLEGVPVCGGRVPGEAVLRSLPGLGDP
jgi:methylated-DNA-[protein]-cysteine S-methyltransferase